MSVLTDGREREQGTVCQRERERERDYGHRGKGSRGAVCHVPCAMCLMLGCGLRRGHPSVTAACTVIDVAVWLEAGDGGRGLPVKLSRKRGLSKLSIKRGRSTKCLEAGLSAWGGGRGGGGGGGFWSKMYSRGKTSTCVGGNPASNMDGCISISPFHQREASRAQAADDYPGTKKRPNHNGPN